jgi:pentatricopeptide repeat protein
MTLFFGPAAVCFVLMLGGLAALSGCSLPRVVVPHDPLTAEEHVTLGEAYRVKGLREAAEREFQTALQRHPDYVPALVSLGNLSFDAGPSPAAEKYFRRALAQDPNHPQANNNLAMVYLSRGERLSEAEELARKALQGPPGLRPYVFDTLITLYLKQGRLEDARTALDEAEQGVPPKDETLRDRFRQLRAELTDRPTNP